jgi:hypothetical protein
MHDPALRREMEIFYDYLENILCHDQLTISSNNYDLVLNIMLNDGRGQWSYYYACHETRCLFWLKTYDATSIISGIDGAESPAHISVLHLSSSSRPPFPLIRYAENRLEALYWCVSCLRLYSPKHPRRLVRKHWSLYPAVFDGRSLPLSICDELMRVLSHGCTGELLRLRQFFTKGQHRYHRCNDFKHFDLAIRC